VVEDWWTWKFLGLNYFLNEESVLIELRSIREKREDAW
jgi:hypothetical protein